MADRRKRKSLSLLRPLISPLTPIHDVQRAETQTPANLLKKRNPTPLFSSGPSSSPTGSPTVSIAESSDLQRASSTSSTDRLLLRPRPRSLQKARPSSFFGSLRSFHSVQDENENLTRTSSIPSSLHSINSSGGQGSGSGLTVLDIAGGTVLHHGETQSTGGMFKKRSHYLVLTETHLVRFKSQGRAAEFFPVIPASSGKSNSIRHSRLSSSGSLYDLHTSSDSYSTVRLNHIVAIHKLEDGRPYFSIEIAHLDQETNHASAMTLQLHDPSDSDVWLSCIRTAAEKARIVDPLPFTKYLIEYTARALEQERDYDPNQFHMFKVVQRATRSGGRSSSDDLAKLNSKICILAIGAYKIHLIPLPKLTKTSSSTSLSEMTGAWHGITTLTSVTLPSSDDTFQLTFRVPLRQSTVLYLASSCATDIALCIRQAAEFLRPEWLEQPFTWNAPPGLEDRLLPIPPKEEDNACFDRTLTAYCAAYSLDTSKIRYLIDHQCEDAPAFQLLPPADPHRIKYTLLELLAVMRALRYNETFTTISFAHIDLNILHGIPDKQGWDHVPWTTRSGEPLLITEQENSWLLVQEVQALALKSRKLRRLDFSYSLMRKPQDEDDAPEVGCGLCEALFPLCAKQLTNVDWIVLNGITLADVDIDFFYAAAIDKSCHFRALHLGSCGLVNWGMNTVLQAISHQGATMESLNLSGNPARIEPDVLHQQIHGFGYLRKLNLSNVCRSSGSDPLVAADALLRWRLEEINFCGTALNENSVEALSTYLRSSQSNTLRSLRLDQCQLTGLDLASLLTAMDRGLDNIRDLHLFVTDNRFEHRHDMFVDAISRSMTPSHMTISRFEYSSEHYFRDLIGALSNNKSLKYLDLSKASLPRDASDETCEALRKMFIENETLEVLDLSGEEAHLEVANFGTGLSYALAGLKSNNTLRILRIEHQRLGLRGANSLASVLEVNSGLRELLCENNEINLQAFTVLVNSLAQNTSLLYLPLMDNDRAASQKKVDREIDGFRESAASLSTRSTVKKTLGAAISSQRSFSSRSHDRSRAAPQAYRNDKEVMAAVGSLSQYWDSESARLQRYLIRNHNLAHGIVVDNNMPEQVDSLATALGDTSLDLTPRVEVDAQLGQAVGATAADGHDERHSSDHENVLDIHAGDDIAGALLMSRSLRG